MRSLRLATLALALVSGWTLACSGTTTPTDGPGVDPEPEPKPDPKPAPAPNAGDCNDYQGVSLPLSGGTITACTTSAVTIDHSGGDTKALRWDYASAYKAKGWTQSDPVNAAPAVMQGSRKIVFENTADAVILRCTGCEAGGGPGGDPDGSPGGPGKRPRPDRPRPPGR